MSSSRMLAARNLMVDWQVAPADWEIVNYDEPKWRYRQSVEKFVHALPMKSLKKKTFVTIATNVLCADLQTKSDTLDPIERDLYLPLEIALTKWSMGESSQPATKRNLNTKVWLVNPGEPTPNSINHANDHKKLHKIKYDKFNDEDRKNTNVHFEQDIQKVVKEINSMLTPDRIVFSTQLRNCRQDLGCLKWMNRETGYKLMKPIAVYSIEDLYVVSLRHLMGAEVNTTINQGMARHRMDSINAYDTKLLCDYHRDNVLEDPDGHSPYCAHALSICLTNSLLNDVDYFTSSSSTGKQDSSETGTNQGH